VTQLSKIGGERPAGFPPASIAWLTGRERAA
jgi:hypothetical protein